MGGVPAVLLANAAAAVVLAVVAGVVCAAVRSPAVAHKAWLLVLLKLVTPPLVVLPVVWPAGGAVADPGPADGADALVPSGGRMPPEVQEDSGGLRPPLGTDDVPPGPVTAGDDTTPDEAPPTAAAEPPAIAPFPWQAVLVAVWAAGAAAYWLLVAVRVVRFRRLLRGATPVPADVAALVRRTADRLGLRRPPAASFVDAAVSPLVWAGLGRPRLVLPERFWDSLTDDQREAVVAHELAHLRRGDHWVRRLELVVLGLYWWFPVAWLAVRRLRDAEEACCDAWVVWALPGRAAAYAEALVEAVAFVSGPGWVPLASGGAARVGALKRRLTMILSNTPARRGRRAVAVGLFAAGLLVLPLRPGLADEPEKPAAEPPAIEPWDVKVFTYPDEEKKPADGPAKRTDLRLPSSYSPTPADVAKLKDELELLEAQGLTKQTQVTAAEVAVRAAQRQTELLAKLGPNVVASGERENVRSTLESAQAQLDVRKAELNEHAVRVRQAKRRLDAATGAADPAGLTRKRAADAPAAGQPNGPAGNPDNLKPLATLRLLQDELEKTQMAAQEVAVQRAELTAKLQVLTARGESISAAIERLRSQLDYFKKTYPDAARPGKP